MNAPGLTKTQPWPSASAVAWVRAQIESNTWDSYEREALAALIVFGSALNESTFRDGYGAAVNASLDEVEHAVRAIRSMPAVIGDLCPHCGGALPFAKP